MVSQLSKMGAKTAQSSATATQALLTYDASLFNLTVEKSKDWTFGQIKAYRNLPGVLGAMYAAGTPWGSVIEYSIALQQMFDLPDAAIFCSAWRDKKSGEVYRMRPTLKAHEGSLVLSIPRAESPIEIEKPKIRISDGILGSFIKVPISLDLDTIQDVYGEMTKDTELDIKLQVADVINDDNLVYVREWKAPASGGSYGKLRDDVEIGLYWCDSVRFKTNEGEKDGKKYKIVSAKFSLTTMTGDRMLADGTESNGRKILASISDRIASSESAMEFGTLATAFGVDEIEFSKPFLLLLTAKTAKGNGVMVDLVSVIPTELPALNKLSPALVKFIESHGQTCDGLYQQWSEGSIAPATEASDTDTAEVDRAALYADIDELRDAKKLTSGAIRAYCNSEFKAARRDDLTLDQLARLVDWMYSQVDPTQGTLVV